MANNTEELSIEAQKFFDAFLDYLAKKTRWAFP
jgi:ribosome assembly protein YihI (activator of Der GTPase)